MGRKLVLNGTKITDTNAPRLITADPLEAAGSLFLADLTHPAGAWASGVPAEGATTPVPNVVETFARALVGAGNLDGQFLREGAWTGTGSLMERTAKGGLHAYPSPTKATGETGAALLVPDVVEEYVRVNSTHAFYASVWGRVTKAGVSGINATWAEFAATAGTAANYLMIGLNGSTSYRSQGQTFPTAVGPAYADMSSSSWTGTKPTNAGSAMFGHMMTLGHYGGWNFQTDAVRQKPALTYYRAYLEDLTVSGRTYAEVSALDRAQYTREVLTVGGRYYGDTFTDPATIA